MIITIDGPTASGKSSVAKALAIRLGFYYFSSGILFRTISYILIHKKGYKESDLTDNVPLHEIDQIIKQCHFNFDSNNGDHMFYADEDINGYIKQSSNDIPASLIGLNNNARILIIEWLRKLANDHNIVIDGRDTGSVVFPNADVKFYLTAPLQIRVERWMQDQKNRGNIIEYESAYKLVSQRDNRDKTRKVAPLIVPENSHVINNENMSIEQTVERMLELIKNTKHK